MTSTLTDYAKDYLFHCKHEKNLCEKSIKAYSIDMTQFVPFAINKDEDSTVDQRWPGLVGQLEAILKW
jgi:site-specific recombinase XerD